MSTHRGAGTRPDGGDVTGDVTGAARVRLYDAVEARRKALGWNITQSPGGMPPGTYYQLQKGPTVRARTVPKIDGWMKWVPGSAEGIVRHNHRAVGWSDGAPRLLDAVAERRGAADFAGADLPDPLYRRLADADPLTLDELGAIDTAMRWVSGSAHGVALRGIPPVPVPLPGELQVDGAIGRTELVLLATGVVEAAALPLTPQERERLAAVLRPILAEFRAARRPRPRRGRGAPDADPAG